MKGESGRNSAQSGHEHIVFRRGQPTLSGVAQRLASCWRSATLCRKWMRPLRK